MTIGTHGYDFILFIPEPKLKPKLLSKTNPNLIGYGFLIFEPDPIGF